MDNNTPETQPQQPIQPQQPQTPMQQPPYGQPSGGKKSPVKLIAIIVGALVLIAGVVVALMLTVFAGPTRADYQTALDDTKAVRDTYQDLARTSTSAVRFNSLSESQANENVETLSTQLAAYKEAVEKLDGQKAFRDEEAKTAYEAFKTENEKFLAFYESFVESYKPVANASATCNDVSLSSSSIITQDNAVERFNEAIKPCVDAINAAKDVPNAEIKELMTAMSDFYGELSGKIAAMAKAYEDRDQSALSAASREVSTMTTAFSTKAREIGTKIDEASATEAVTDKINDLGSLLTDKVNGDA